MCQYVPSLYQYGWNHFAVDFPKLLCIYVQTLLRKINCCKKVINHRSVYIDLLPHSGNTNEFDYWMYLLIATYVCHRQYVYFLKTCVFGECQS